MIRLKMLYPYELAAIPTNVKKMGYLINMYSALVLESKHDYRTAHDGGEYGLQQGCLFPLQVFVMFTSLKVLTSASFTRRYKPCAFLSFISIFAALASAIQTREGLYCFDALENVGP